MFNSASKNRRIQVTLSPQMHQKLQDRASEQNLSISKLIAGHLEASFDLSNSAHPASLQDLRQLANQNQKLLAEILQYVIKSTVLLEHSVAQSLGEQAENTINDLCIEEYHEVFKQATTLCESNDSGSSR